MTMSLKKFSLPGKDSRCIRQNKQVYKIKTRMPPPKNGHISDYLDEQTLQGEIEDIFRALLAMPHSVSPVMMMTDHLDAQAERKQWVLPMKVHFKEHGNLLEAHSSMFVLNLKIIEQERAAVAITKIEAQTHFRPDKKSNSIAKSTSRVNKRKAPSCGSPNTCSGYALGKRSLTLSSVAMGAGGGGRSYDDAKVSPDKIDMDEQGMIDEGDEEREDKKTSKRTTDREEIKQRQGSQELESGFNRLVQVKAAAGPEKYIRVNEGHEAHHRHTKVPCTGDQGVIPARPADGEAAMVGHSVHPGRQRVEQHVLAEQLRLQEMAGPSGDAQPLQEPQQQEPESRGLVRQMLEAVVTPVKHIFS